VIGYVFVAMAAIGWGLWPLVLSHAPMAPELQSAIVMLVITVVSAPLVFVLKDRVRAPAGLRAWLGIVWLGIADSANVGLFFAAYQRTSVAIAVLTHYLTPIFVALAAPLALGERLGRRTVVAVAIAFSGLVLLLEPWRADVSRSDLLGAALGAGSALFYASNVIMNKRLAPVFSGSELMFFHGLVGVPLLWAFVLYGACARARALSAVPTSALGAVVGGSVVLGALGGLLFVWGLRRVAASHASILTLLEPLVAVTTATIFLGQRIGPVPLGGGALILVGAGVVVSPRFTREDRVRSPTDQFDLETETSE
jgi:drug/metabolite transporter (DMT)-like permease